MTQPFLCLNITCPVAAYDVNVEPAKDDVLFVDEEAFLHMCETFFHSYYIDDHNDEVEAPDLIVPGNLELLLDDKSASRSSQQSRCEGTELQMYRMDTMVSCSKPSANIVPSIADQALSSPPNARPRHNFGNVRRTTDTESLAKWQTSMYDGNDGPLPKDCPDTQDENVADEDADSQSLNPWSIAKMNAPLNRRQRGVQENVAPFKTNSNRQLMTPRPERVSMPLKFNSSSPLRASNVPARSPQQYLPSPPSRTPLLPRNFGLHSLPSRRSLYPGTRPDQRSHVDVEMFGPEPSFSPSLTNALQRAPRLQGTSVNKPFVIPTTRQFEYPGPEIERGDPLQRPQGSSEPASDIPTELDLTGLAEAAYDKVLALSGESGNADRVCNLRLHHKLDLDRVRNMAAKLLGCDEYVQKGEIPIGFAKPDPDNWTTRLMQLLPAKQQAAIDLKRTLIAADQDRDR